MFFHSHTSAHRNNGELFYDRTISHNVVALSYKLLLMFQLDNDFDFHEPTLFTLVSRITAHESYLA